MTTWLNHVAIAAPRNGTTTHTVDPSTGTVVTGTLFTPTAGRFLLCVAEGAVTSTTPSGWTLPTNGSAINNTGLYVWTKTAAGSDSITTTHNGSNYPMVFDFYEFASGSTFSGAASATAVSNNAANPALTGLTGTNFVMYAAAISYPQTTGTNSMAWSTGVEAVDTFVFQVTTDGYVYSLAYIEDFTGTSATTNSPSHSGSVGGISQERLTFAVKISGAATPLPPELVMQSRRAY